jgi:hypothetical protein
LQRDRGPEGSVTRTELRNVTPDGRSKDHFVIIDAVGLEPVKQCSAEQPKENWQRCEGWGRRQFAWRPIYLRGNHARKPATKSTLGRDSSSTAQDPIYPE